jgi:signal transduction histidine kinase
MMPRSRARGLGRAAAATSLLGIALAVAGAWLSVTVIGVDLPGDLEAGPSGWFLVGTLAFVAAGGLLARARPANAVGWVLLAIGIVWQLYALAGLGRVAAYVSSGVASGPWLAWAWDVLWVPGVALVPALFLVFPEGRLPSRSWRWVAILLAAATATLFVAVGLRPGAFTNTPLDNPIGIAALARLAPALEAVGNLMVVVAVMAALAAPVLRYRRAGAEERHRLKWFLAAITLVVIAWVAAEVLAASGAPGWLLGHVRTVPLLALPVAIVVSILHHRLFDMDLVISKSLLYASLAGFVALLYLGVVVGIGTAVGVRDGMSVPLTVAATALVATAFQPARRRLQHLADRAVYGRRASPYDVLATFIGRMAGAYPAGEAPAAIAEGVGVALGLARCDVWLRSGGALHLAARWPARPHEGRIDLPAEGTAVALPGSDRAYAVHHDGRLLGAIGVATRAGADLTVGEDRLLGTLAETAWLALENAQLVRDLRTSRERLVAAGDTQRRHIERDLHDGAQQRLLELALTLRMAQQQAATGGAAAAAETIAGAERLLRVALAELRDLARGIHPAILTERGLVAAVESLAERAPLPVTVTTGRIERMRPTVEATAYFVSAEAVSNVIKHAAATTASIGIEIRGERLFVEIRDDGRGGADAAAPGLAGLADRVAALGGRLEIRSPLGGGTSVLMELPCA